MKNFKKGKDALLVSNASLAEYNLSQEPKLITGRQQLGDIYVKSVELQKQLERDTMRLGVHLFLKTRYSSFLQFLVKYEVCK